MADLARVTGVLALVSGVLLLGCAGPTEPGGMWAGTFEPAQPFERAPVARVQMEAAPYELLAEEPELAGYELLGSAEFRDERPEESPLTPGSPLERFAQEIGADLVRLGVRPAGTETRTRSVRTRSVLTPPSTSPAGSPRPVGESDRVGVPVEVEVFDHLAVFYRSAD